MGVNMSKTYAKVSGAFVLALFIATALTGVQQTVAGYSSQCIDNLDNNDGDGLVDGEDLECLMYPFEDGGGEFTTTQGKMWSSDIYTYTVLEYQSTYGSPQVLFELCNQQAAKQSEFDLIETASGGKDTSGSDYPTWVSSNCPP